MSLKTLPLQITYLGFLLTLGACASLQSASLSSIPATRDRVVSAEASRTVFLGFNFDNDYVNSLEADLKRQCVGGDVRGILTKDEVVNYFLMIVHKRRVSASGYCVGGARS
jgi:hypothetical protein